jgi:hypothetical protein
MTYGNWGGPGWSGGEFVHDHRSTMRNLTALAILLLLAGCAAPAVPPAPPAPAATPPERYQIIPAVEDIEVPDLDRLKVIYDVIL